MVSLQCVLMVCEIVCIRTYVVLYCMAVYIEAHMITVFFYKLKVCSNPRLSDDGEHFFSNHLFFN